MIEALAQLICVFIFIRAIQDQWKYDLTSKYSSTREVIHAGLMIIGYATLSGIFLFSALTYLGVEYIAPLLENDTVRDFIIRIGEYAKTFPGGY